MNKEDWRLEDASFESISRQELLRGYVSRNQVMGVGSVSGIE